MTDANGVRLVEDAEIKMDIENSLSVPNFRKDFVDWRKGRGRYAVWAIDIDLSLVRAASESMRCLLADVLLPDYARQPHLTLSICGFPAAEKTHDDDYVPGAFIAQINALEEAGVEPFSISIGMPGTFTAAPYFSVGGDLGAITRLRHALGSNGPGEAGFRYLPHVTFGLYGNAIPLAPVMRRLRSAANPDIDLTVRQIALMTYDAAVIDGALQSICEFDLSLQSMRILDPSAMAALA